MLVTIRIMPDSHVPLLRNLGGQDKRLKVNTIEILGQLGEFIRVGKINLVHLGKVKGWKQKIGFFGGVERKRMRITKTGGILGDWM